MSLTPRFNPPVVIPSGFSDYITWPAGPDPDGIFLLGHQGDLYCFSVPVTHGVNGLAWISGQHAERLDYPNATELAANPNVVVTILRTDGQRNARAPS